MREDMEAAGDCIGDLERSYAKLLGRNLARNEPRYRASEKFRGPEGAVATSEGVHVNVFSRTRLQASAVQHRKLLRHRLFRRSLARYTQV